MEVQSNSGSDRSRRCEHYDLPMRGIQLCFDGQQALTLILHRPGKRLAWHWWSQSTLDPRHGACASHDRELFRHRPAFLREQRLDRTECRLWKGQRARGNAYYGALYNDAAAPCYSLVIDFR